MPRSMVGTTVKLKPLEDIVPRKSHLFPDTLQGIKYGESFYLRTHDMKDNTYRVEFPSMTDRAYPRWIDAEWIADYEQKQEVSVMKVKIGDKITLKKWDDIDHKNRIPFSGDMKVHPIKQHKEIYDEKMECEVIALPGNNVVNIKIPVKAYFPYWDILEKDIHHIVGRKMPSQIRQIKQTSPKIIEDRDEDTPLREVEIRLGEMILLHIEGEENPVQVRFEHKHFFKDNSPKKVARLELSGEVIPQVIKKIRLIRG